jgi:hypothetical protein
MHAYYPLEYNKAYHITSSKPMKDSQMEVDNAIQLTYLLGGMLSLIKNIGTPTCSCVS